MISDTSRAAFNRVQPKISRRQAEVLAIIRAHPEGLTDAETCHYLGDGWTINRVTPRRGELEKLGLIFRGAPRACRKTKSAAYPFKALPDPFPSAREEKPLEQKQTLF